MSDTLAAAVGHIPSGLFIVCSRDKNSKKNDGYLASWVQQVSFDPLMVSLCIKPGRPAYDLILSGEIFTINVVGDHEKDFLKYFWKGYDEAHNPFAEIGYKISKNGGILIEAAKSVIECRLHSKITPGDHDLVLAHVVESYVHHVKSKPLTHIRKTGLDY